MKIFAFLAFCAVLFSDDARSWKLENPVTNMNEDLGYETTAVVEEEDQNDSSNFTQLLDELAANADGIEIFLAALEEVVLDGGSSVKIPEEIDPEEHNITVEDAFDRIEDFLEDQIDFSRNLLADMEKMEKENNSSSLAEAREDVLDMIQGFVDAKEDIGNYRKSQSVELMYEYYQEEQSTDEIEEEDEDEKFPGTGDADISSNGPSSPHDSAKTVGVRVNLESDIIQAGFDEDPSWTDMIIESNKPALHYQSIHDVEETTFYPYVNDAIVASEEFNDTNKDVTAYSAKTAIANTTTVVSSEDETRDELVVFIDKSAKNDDTRLFHGFHFPTRLYVSIAVPIAFFFVVVVVFAAYRQRVSRRLVNIKARSLEEVTKEKHISVVSICDAHKFKNIAFPTGKEKLPSYLEVISEKVEPQEQREK